MYIHPYGTSLNPSLKLNFELYFCLIQGCQTGGGGWGGLNPPLILDGEVEHLSTPPDFEKFFLGGVGSP